MVCYDLKIYCLTTATNFSGLFLLFFWVGNMRVLLLLLFFSNISSNKVGFFFFLIFIMIIILISNDQILLKENKPNYTRGVFRKEYSQDLKLQCSNISKKTGNRK